MVGHERAGRCRTTSSGSRFGPSTVRCRRTSVIITSCAASSASIRPGAEAGAPAVDRREPVRDHALEGDLVPPSAAAVWARSQVIRSLATMGEASGA